MTAAPVENVARGTVLSALITIPAGVTLWILLWEAGVVVGIVGFGVAAAAVALYRLGAGGLSRVGAVRATVITGVTLIVGIVGGLAADVVPAFVSYTGLPWAGAIVSPEFWRFFGSIVTDPQYIGRTGFSILLALVFAALGCYGTLRRALHETRAPIYTTYFGPGVPPPVPRAGDDGSGGPAADAPTTGDPASAASAGYGLGSTASAGDGPASADPARPESERGDPASTGSTESTGPTGGTGPTDGTGSTDDSGSPTGFGYDDEPPSRRP